MPENNQKIPGEDTEIKIISEDTVIDKSNIEIDRIDERDYKIRLFIDEYQNISKQDIENVEKLGHEFICFKRRNKNEVYALFRGNRDLLK